MSLASFRSTRSLAALCSLVILFSAIPFQAFAQSESQDFESPVIEHDPLDYGKDDSLQIFSATVVDNVAVKSVFLHYRYGGQEDYKSVEMNPVAISSVYSARVYIDESPEGTIEYFIQAEDTSGNVVLQGFAFEPLVRTLSLVDASSTISETAEQPGETLETEKPKSRIVYYVLGALAVGALAAGLSGGGGEDGDGTSGCTDGSCDVTITISPP